MRLRDKIKWTRWAGSNDGRPAMYTKVLFSFMGFEAIIHCFVRADDPTCFHTHPAYAFRLILWGGYEEELGDGTFAEWHIGDAGVVKPDLEHRISRLLNGKESWSLWLRGPKFKPVKDRGC